MAQMGGVPMDMGPQIMRQGAMENKGETARLEAFVGAIAVGELVKTTLGPRGMDKILQSVPMHEGATQADAAVTVTNDGATILKSVWIDNPAAKILVDLSKTQDQQCGDGTTSVVVLAAEILRKAEELVNNKIHPQIIIEGFRRAHETAKKTLESLAFDNGKNAENFREDLLNIARTTLSSKLVKHEKNHFAELCVDAVLRLKGKPNLDYIQVLKKQGSSLKHSYLEDGFLLEKKIGVGMPKFVENCKVMVANTPMDTDKIKIYGARVQVSSFDAVAEIEQAEKDKMKQKCEKIIGHGCNVFINRQLIYNYPEQLFKNAGVMAIEHSDFEGTERLAAVLGADIVSSFNTPDAVQLGRCERIQEIMIGEDKIIQFKGCAEGEACTVVLRGASQHVLDEAERSLHDAIAVVYQTVGETRVVYGGGCCEMEMSKAVKKVADETDGKIALCIEAYGKALEQIPLILADNGGFDSSELVGQLRASHTRGEADAGLNLEDGEVSSMRKLGIFESYRSKMSQLNAASEAAEQIIRVDDIIHCEARQRQQ